MYCFSSEKQTHSPEKTAYRERMGYSKIVEKLTESEKILPEFYHGTRGDDYNRIDFILQPMAAGLPIWPILRPRLKRFFANTC